MIILMAPSEGKKSGGEASKLDISSLVFNDMLNEQRLLLTEKYRDILASSKRDIKIEMLGIKKENIIEHYEHLDILDSPLLPAIERYDGVAFDYLDYDSLTADSKIYISKHLYIFSNLFGILRASDMIPDYRVKQGAKIGEYSPDKIYAPVMRELDKKFEGEDILDIRAGFYDKFYKPKIPYATLKFLKNGKVVSHWAKAWRGLVLRYVSGNGINSLDEFEEMPMNGLKLKEIQQKGLKREYIYEIEE